MDLIKEAAELNIEISEKQNENLEKYAEMMLRYNEFMNLTAITEPDEIREKHFLDSITLLLSGKISEGCTLIDIGAGAGFPSIPVKIVRDDINLTMLDSLNKRINFLNDVIKEIDIKNARAIHSRAEDAGKNKELRESFDIATARAVADLAVLAEYALPFVKVGGYFVAMKGTAPREEIENAKKAIREMGGEIEEVKEALLPSGIRHSLVIIRKVIPTPSKYPRKAGKPSKEPIC
jgi:16S rRNA (guanine527-N7)-methyltransferase